MQSWRMLCHKVGQDTTLRRGAAILSGHRKVGFNPPTLQDYPSGATLIGAEARGSQI